MRRIYLPVTLLMAPVLIFSGCGIGKPNVKKEVNKQCEELMADLGKDDTDGIKQMFCTAVSGSGSFDSELQKAVEFFEGEVVSYDLKGIASDEKAEFCRTKMIHVSPKVMDVETSAGKSYKVSWYAYLVESEHPEYVGISEIQIKRDDGEEFRLGDYSLVDPK